MFSSNATQVSAVTQAEAVDYDGTNDYLSRSSDLTGNTDSKTFTFSAWVWWGGSANLEAIYIASTAGDSSYGLDIYIDSGGAGQPRVLAKNSAGTTILRMDSGVYFSKNTFNHFLISVDLTNTANRYVYINDVLTSPTWVTYTNDFIDNTRQYHGVGASGATGSYKCLDRLSNVFLDYTYRDLSITANRRLFITADLKPAAGQAALSPILYLPMSDPTTVGTNTGTGGNFTLNGTIARSGRGPNQYNVPYSTFDGSVDYLSRTTAPTGIADGKQFTLAFCFNAASVASDFDILTFSTSTTYRFRVRLAGGGVPDIVINAYSSAGTQILSSALNAGGMVANRNYVVVLSYDMSSSALRSAYVNGVATAISASVYTNSNIDFAITSIPRYYIGAGPTPSLYWNGQLGALWFNTSYIDLSVASNLAKFVSGTGIDAKPVDLGATGELPTGTAPLIYLPMYGNNAGKNYGTGGDFTVNSGPYTGARGPNEFWGNYALGSASGYLYKSGAIFADGKILSGSFFCKMPATTSDTYVYVVSSATTYARFNITINWNSTGTKFKVSIVGYTNNTTAVLSAVTTTGSEAILAAGATAHVCFSFDLSDTAKRSVYVNNVAMPMSWTIYSNTNIDFSPSSSPENWIGENGTDIPGDDVRWYHSLAELYLTSTYIDFSQEANRLLFRDAFGYPTNLPSAITALTVPNPAIYMRFPPTSFGTNSGTGGDFTVNGTITDGGQL